MSESKYNNWKMKIEEEGLESNETGGGNGSQTHSKLILCVMSKLSGKIVLGSHSLFPIPYSLILFLLLFVVCGFARAQSGNMVIELARSRANPAHSQYIVSPLLTPGVGEFKFDYAVRQ